jgi:2-oxoglutarate/2-oxoacid ferredoxin oxidoreductase subunit beta
MSDLLETPPTESEDTPQYKKKDFMSDQVIRWCPGCGDYSILSQVQTTLANLGLHPHEVAVISGIGCSSRFPYYMNTYGFHTIHGRAPAFATAVKCVNQDLSVWLISGDGDGLSIGGNHTAHILRRNVNLQFLLFNNRIYGLTKGQYSPTSEVGKKTKSSPLGSLDHPFKPLAFALGAGATFLARTADVMPKPMRAVLEAAHHHQGTAFCEILQNCNIFNDKAFASVVDRKQRAEKALFLEHGKPMVFAEGTKGIRLNGMTPEIIELGGEYTEADCLVHDETDRNMAHLLVHMDYPDFPVPFGVIHRVERGCYDDAINDQVDYAVDTFGQGDLQALIYGGNTWTVE